MSFDRRFRTLFEDAVRWNVVDPAISRAIKRVRDEVGGDISDEKAVSAAFETIRASLDSIPSKLFTGERVPGLALLYAEFLKENKAAFLERFAKSQESVLNDKINQIKSLDADLDWQKHRTLMLEVMSIADRFLKISKLVGHNLKANEQAAAAQAPETNLLDAMRVANRGMGNVYQLINTTERRRVENIPETPEGDDLLRRMMDMMNTMGIMDDNFRNIFREKGRRMDSRLTKTYRRNWSEVKRVIRTIGRLIDAVYLAQLPAMSHDKIEAQGDYFKFFKTLEKQNPKWMEQSLRNYVFKSSLAKLTDFNGRARQTESAQEADQLNYLEACRSWIITFIRIEGRDILIKREEDSYIKKLDKAVIEKQKEIKNFYLARDFNLENFDGLSISPEIRLPLYAKVELPVSEAARQKESPLRVFVKGLMKSIGGLFGAIPDHGDMALARAAAERNKAVMVGISAMVKAGVIAIGGKQAGRDYTEKVEAPLFNKKDQSGKPIKEEMLSLDDASVQPTINLEAPTEPKDDDQDMDTMSLAGPQRKKRTREFKDFLGKA